MLRALFCIVAVAAAFAAHAQSVVLYEGARLIAGDGSAAIEDAVLLVENDTIKAVGKRGTVTAPAGARREIGRAHV